MNTTTTGCGIGTCFGGAGGVILNGMAGPGPGLIVGYFHHQLRIDCRDTRRPGGIAGPIPVRIDYPEDTTDYNIVDVYISFKWPFMKEHKRMKFVFEKKWANVIVNRINQINTFNEKFNVNYTNFKDGFKVKYSDFKDKFGVKWKK